MAEFCEEGSDRGAAWEAPVRRWTCGKMCLLQLGLEFRGLLVSRATPECWLGTAPAKQCISSSGSWEAAAQALQLAGGRWNAASVANALDALFNTYIKRVLISKSVSYANEWQLHLEEHPTV